MSYLAKEVDEKKKGKKKYYKAYTSLMKLATGSIKNNSFNRKRLIRKFKKIYEKKNYFRYYREQSRNYYKELEIYNKFILFLSNDIKILEKESNNLIILNSLSEQVLFLTDNDSEKKILKKIFEIFKTILSFNSNSELRTFIEEEEENYSLIYRVPRFNKFPKDKYYSLLYDIFLQIIGIKARETDIINILMKRLDLE